MTQLNPIQKRCSHTNKSTTGPAQNVIDLRAEDRLFAVTHLNVRSFDSCAVLNARQQQTLRNSKIEMKRHLFLISIFYLLLGRGKASDQFDEELFIKPLSTGHVNTYFQFTTEWLVQNNESRM